MTADRSTRIPYASRPLERLILALAKNLVVTDESGNPAYLSQTRDQFISDVMQAAGGQANPVEVSIWYDRLLENVGLKPLQADAIKRALEMAGRVKALVWKDCSATAASEVYAKTAFGLYMVDRCMGGSFLLTHCDIGIGRYTTIEAAKAAAQADYQTRGDAMRPAITADDVLRELGE